MNLLLPESGLLFWMTIIFAIVFFVLAKFGFPVITGMVEKRSRRINESLEAARVAEEAIENLNRTKEQVLTETRTEQDRLMKEAAAERDRILQQAQTQAREEAEDPPGEGGCPEGYPPGSGCGLDGCCREGRPQGTLLGQGTAGTSGQAC